mmetsp:Transcript_6461/g.11514  ORF Transcript_6461/g.11514 Transcript_6461/m.11514 type:complete len:237 (-) Transcript_6461:4995-5705(-)
MNKHPRILLQHTSINTPRRNQCGPTQRRMRHVKLTFRHFDVVIWCIGVQNQVRMGCHDWIKSNGTVHLLDWNILFSSVYKCVIPELNHSRQWNDCFSRNRHICRSITQQLVPRLVSFHHRVLCKSCVFRRVRNDTVCCVQRKHLARTPAVSSIKPRSVLIWRHSQVSHKVGTSSFCSCVIETDPEFSFSHLFCRTVSALQREFMRRPAKLCTVLRCLSESMPSNIRSNAHCRQILW